MKILAKFYGRVKKLNPVPNPSFVTLINTKTNERMETDAITYKLLEKGIDHEGCDFEIIIQESLDGNPEAILTKLEPNPLTPGQILEIKEKFKDRWTFMI